MVLRINVLWYNRVVFRQFILRKNWTHMPSASGFYSRLAGKQNRNELQNFYNCLQVKLFGFLLYSIAVQCYYNVRNAPQSAFLK